MSVQREDLWRRVRGVLHDDLAIAVALFVAAVAYMHFLWPNSMVGLDEGGYLYAAKRIIDGDVMYRDFFDLIGPLPFYAMAFMYAVFGVSMETARWSMALLHGGIVFLLYWIVRRLGARPILAATVSMAHVVLLYPALAFASPHWVSTLLTVIVFWFVLRTPVERRGQALSAGALTALVCLSQQQKGVATAAAVAIVLVRDAWTARRTSPLLAALVRQLTWCAAGVLAVLVPTLAGFALYAGVARLYEALVYTPLVSYRNYAFVSEGRWLFLALEPWMLKDLALRLSPILYLNVMPFIIPLGAARLLWKGMHGVSAEERRPLFVALVFSALSMVSVFYQPNHFHFAIVGAIWLSLYGELIERVVRRIERAWRVPYVASATALAMLLLLTLETRRLVRQAWTTAGAPGDTVFGRVHFRSAALADEVRAVHAILQAAGAREIFVYPTNPSIYLMTQTVNPTRFQLLFPGYNTPEQFAEVQATLERQRVPFVLRTFWWWDNGDPLQPYLREHYVRVPVPREHKGMPAITVFRRKADGAGDPTT